MVGATRTRTVLLAPHLPTAHALGFGQGSSTRTVDSRASCGYSGRLDLCVGQDLMQAGATTEKSVRQ